MSTAALDQPPSAVWEAKTRLREDSWCVLEGVLSPEEAARGLDRLWAAAAESRRRGLDTYMPQLDPNAANIRVFNLIDLDPLYRDLVARPIALDLVESLLGPDFLISNFTANIARPGARSMSLHSDQALVVPEPWLEPWSINIIWCLTEVRAQNGATLFIPGSQRLQRRCELGEDPAARLVPFSAPAGSILAMDGRVWHTSGANVTADEDRALLFGYYSRSFLRPQVNFNAMLSAETQAALDPKLRVLLGLETSANVGIAAELLSADLGRAREAVVGPG